MAIALTYFADTCPTKPWRRCCVSRRPRADVILRVTSNAALHVVFHRSARRAAATP
ncbi:MAG: hypothetical protein ACN6O8_19790 [Achromobacter sp.]|uniref:hypothetical protein n=1 Tax=Achromobacter sp. TaxID=134375 RepID=UPI003D02DDB3